MSHLSSQLAHKTRYTHRHDAIIQQDLKELASQAGANARDKHLTIFRITNETDRQRPDLLLR